MRLYIRTSGIAHYTHILEQMHRSALPVAIRTALNSTAYDMKKNTLPESADKTFVKRRANFFKANSKVVPATGFNTRNMKSQVGFYSNNLKGSDNYAVDDLEEQEYGGDIGGKSFIPMNAARIENNLKRLVRNVNRTTAINGLVNSNNSKFTGKQKLIRAAFYAKKQAPSGGKAFVLNEGPSGKTTLWRIDRIESVNGKLKFKAVGLYSYKAGRSVHVKATGFNEKAALEAHSRIDQHYVDAAEKQIARLIR